MDLKTLAAHLKLSQTTVSRALNGYADVSAATRARVVQAAAELGYEPNPVARNLALGRANAVGIVYPIEVDDVADPRFLEVVSGITEALSESNVDLFLVSATHHGELETYSRLIQSRRVDGFVLARTLVDDPRIDFLQQSGVPFLGYGRTAHCEDYPWFDFDNAEGSVLAVERLVSLGHRQIAYIHASLHYNFAYQRHEGFVRGMQQAGVPLRNEWMIQAALSQCAGYEAMIKLLEQPELPTAVFIDNNLAGVGAIGALVDRGLTIGKDISIIVYDGVPPDSLLTKSGMKVTSVIQPTQQRAGDSMAALIHRVLRREEVPMTELQVLCQPALLPGDSDGVVG
ncbi:substrate-binding domain-containing protein [Burkholderiaceae bacterium DAT-1]|nr:substrate-binding domain-containing protein [Burkholderiaceae bacterium DAT-1]